MISAEAVGRRVSPLSVLKEAGYSRVGTTAIIRSQDGKYLLVKENRHDGETGKKPGTWSFPSEKSKTGENFMMTLARGLVEELPPGMKELFAECIGQGLLSERRFNPTRKLTAVSQRLTMVPSEAPDIAL